jgi:hypothetical protein
MNSEMGCEGGSRIRNLSHGNSSGRFLKSRDLEDRPVI